MSTLPANPLDLSRQAAIWRCIEQMMPRIAAQLEHRFQVRHGACPDDAVASAVRVLLVQIQDGAVFESPHQIYAWLVVTAGRRLLDRMAREHLERRQELPEDLSGWEDELREQTWEAAMVECDALHRSLNAEQQVVLEGRRQRMTYAQIAAQNGWTETRVHTLWRQICRLARCGSGSEEAE